MNDIFVMTILSALCFGVGMISGGTLNGQRAFEDCANKHEAKLFNGSVIECKAKESK